MDRRAEIIIRKIIREAIEEMSGFARARRMMMGDVDSVNSLGIMTAENPMGEKAPQAQNRIMLSELSRELRQRGYGFIKIKGKYKTEENSVIIPNIKKEELIDLGRKYEQESVIFGNKEYTKDFAYFKFEYIRRGEIKDTKMASLSSGDVQSREDLFSAIKSRKFYIPFFDDAGRYEKPDVKYGAKREKPTEKPQPDNSFKT